MKNRIKLYAIIILSIILFSGCGSKFENVNTPKKGQNIKKVGVISIEESENFVRKFYSREIVGSIDEINGYYYDSKNSNFARIKDKLKAFKVKKVELVKTLSKQKNKNMVVMTCIYNTYFDTIKSYKSYPEVIPLIFEKGKWYIINNYKNMPIDDIKWVRKTKQKQENLMYDNKEIQQIQEKNNNFDKENKEFLKKAQDNMLQ